VAPASSGSGPADGPAAGGSTVGAAGGTAPGEPPAVVAFGSELPRVRPADLSLRGSALRRRSEVQ